MMDPRQPAAVVADMPSLAKGILSRSVALCCVLYVWHDFSLYTIAQSA